LSDAQNDAAQFALPPSIAQLDPVDRANVRPLAALDWMPSGKVLRDFIMAPDPVTAIMGPWGSGKTTGGFIKGLLCSCVVPRSPLDGVRYARGVVVRDTYRNLEMNVIPSWQERFPPNLGSFKGGGGGEPAKAVIDFELAPEEILHLEVIFAALGDHNVKTFCDGFQATWSFLNALDALPPEIISFMWPRLGRWPPPQHRPPDWKDHVRRWRKLFGDMNAPDMDNWTYGDEENNKKGFVECVPDRWKIFVQPGGLDPHAENVENLPPDYYPDLVSQNEEWWNNRFVHNKFGFSRAGSPVYPKWNDSVHVMQKEVDFDRNRKLALGVDGGRDACAIAGQRRYGGGLDVLREYVPKQRMGAKQFGKWLSLELARDYPDADVIAYLDPATYNPNDLDDDALWADIFKQASGITCKSAPTNALTARLGAVNDLLMQFDGDRPGYQISKKCRRLRRGFNSEYRFGTEKKHGDEVDTEAPVKNKASHPHDANQYLCLGTSDFQEVKARQSRRGPRVEETTWDPLG